MRKALILVALATLPLTASADQYVHGYTRSNGTYVEGYHRSSPNSTTMDNYSTQGNSNPYTGQMGNQPATPNYPTTAPRGLTGPSPSYRLRY